VSSGEKRLHGGGGGGGEQRLRMGKVRQSGGKRVYLGGMDLRGTGLDRAVQF